MAHTFDREIMGKHIVFCLLFLCCLPAAKSSGVGPSQVPPKETSSSEIMVPQIPKRVVCLVPSITQILVDLGQQEKIVALSRQDLINHASFRKKSTGSYFKPDTEAIRHSDPDLVICSPKHAEYLKTELDSTIPLLVITAQSMDETFEQIHRLGKMFQCEEKAGEILARIHNQLSQVAQRLDREHDLKKKRVVRVMAGDALTVPGDDSFQNEMIRAAGGITAQWGENGFAVPMDPEIWQEFNPQVIYGCKDNADKVRQLLQTEPYRNVEAVQEGRIHMFPCRMTCYASSITGNFVQWLAAVLYPDICADPQKAVTADAILRHTPVTSGLDYVQHAEVIEHRLADSTYKSLVLTFDTPQTVLSTFEGLRENIRGCGNTFVPMAASLGHMRNGVEQVKKTLANNLGFSEQSFTTLMTGANMDNLAVVSREYKDLKVTAMVTGGVRGNAMRLSRDTGYYASHGTINIIVASNRKLSTAAMTRAIITVTEAKTAALTDLDIRSAYTPWPNQATGTGTDNVLVVQGEGPWIEFAGGHSKLAQLMAEAVHEGVTQALARQNGILADRNIVQRLFERGLSLEKLVQHFESGMNPRILAAKLEKLLKQSYYAAFVEAALAASDAGERGLMRESVFWDEVCENIVVKLCGTKRAPALCNSKSIPPTVAKAFGALITGIEFSGEYQP